MSSYITKLREDLILYLYYDTSGAAIIVNTNYSGVEKPEDIKDTVKFIISKNSSPNLQSNENGITVSMMRNAYPFTCFFPWNSIISVQSLDESVILSFPKGEILEEIKKEEKVSESTEKLAENIISVDFKRRVKLN